MIEINNNYDVKENSFLYKLSEEEIFDENLYNKLKDDITKLIYKDKINKKDIIKVSTIYQNILKR
jgi:hypothetical protein